MQRAAPDQNTVQSDREDGALRPPPRRLFEVRGDQQGPCLIILASMHGNEPSGVLAVKRIEQAMSSRIRANLRGDLVCLLGHRTAYLENRRYISHDLNRVWTHEHVSRIRAMNEEELAASTIEDREQRELLDELALQFQRARGPVIFVDLHTTSAESRPFVLIGDTLRNRAFARAFPAPIVLGLEEQIDGAITEWVNAQGHVSLGFESGQHLDPESIDRHEAGLWLALVAADMLPAEEIPEFESKRSTLADAARGLPRFIEVRYRHGVRPDDEFIMEPGYENFHPVQHGEILATDRHGPIRARERGRVLLPLYQGDGSDGFFIARRVLTIWLAISVILRTLRIDRIVALLPGVRRDPERKDVLLVNPFVARFLAIQIFHLLGYRKRRREGSMIVMTRRDDGSS